MIKITYKIVIHLYGEKSLCKQHSSIHWKLNVDYCTLDRVYFQEFFDQIVKSQEKKIYSQRFLHASRQKKSSLI